MHHTVSVDLSAKVEQWSKDTAVAFSDGINGSIFVNKKTKKAARNWVKTVYPNRKPTFYVYLLFAILIYLAIKLYVDKIRHIEIDQDYSGSQTEGDIKSWLLHLLHRHNPSLRGRFISFREIKGSNADILAREIFQEARPADRKIYLSDIKEALALLGK